MTDTSTTPRMSYLAVASLVLAALWYVGWIVTLTFAVMGLRDPQGWNWLPYVVWGMWGLPIAILAALFAAWSLWSIGKRRGQLTGNGLALSALIFCCLALPIFYFTPMIVNLWK